MNLDSIDILEIARKKAGFTQKELANILGISLPTYCRLIKSENLDKILFVHAKKLEKLLSVNFDITDDIEFKVKIITE